MLTRSNHFDPNQSGIGSLKLNNNYFIYTISEFCWVGGGAKVSDDFFENHFFFQFLTFDPIDIYIAHAYEIVVFIQMHTTTF